VSIEPGPEGADVELVEVRDVRQKLACSGPDPGQGFNIILHARGDPAVEPGPGFTLNNQDQSFNLLNASYEYLV